MHDKDKLAEVANMAQWLNEHGDELSEYLTLEDAYYTRESEHLDFPTYCLHVIVSDVRGYIKMTHTATIADVCRDHGFYLHDSVVNWQEETIRMRFGIDE